MKKDRIIKLIAIGFFSVVFIAVTYDAIMLNKYGKCTAGEIIGYTKDGNSRYSMVYRYYVNNNEYKARAFGYSKKNLFKKFRVLYNERRPEISIIYLDEPINNADNEQIHCKKKYIFFKLFDFGKFKEGWTIYTD